MRKRKVVDLDGGGSREDLGEVGGEGTIVRLYCITCTYIFSKRILNEKLCISVL